MLCKVHSPQIPKLSNEFSFIAILVIGCRMHFRIYILCFLLRLELIINHQLWSLGATWPKFTALSRASSTQLPFKKLGHAWIKSLTWCLPKGPLCIGKFCIRVYSKFENQIIHSWKVQKIQKSKKMAKAAKMYWKVQRSAKNCSNCKKSAKKAKNAKMC